MKTDKKKVMDTGWDMETDDEKSTWEKQSLAK